MLLLKFFCVCVLRKSFLNKGWEYGCLSHAAIAEFLELSLWEVLMPGKNEGRIWGQFIRRKIKDYHIRIMTITENII